LKYLSGDGRALKAVRNARITSHSSELIEVLGLPKPDPAAATHEQNDYVFERAVRKHKDEGDSLGRIDLYKKNSFVLEAKQSRLKGVKKVAGQNDLFTADVPEDSRGRRGADRAWDVLMLNAKRQAEEYARALPTSHGWPSNDTSCGEQLVCKLDDKSRSFWDEQQKLVSDVEEGRRTVSALRIYGAVLSILNIFENVMARAPRKEAITTDPMIAFDGARRFESRFDCADETTLLVVERLSAKLLLRSDSAEAELAAKAVRALVLGEFLSHRFATVEPVFAMRADAIGKKLISDLFLSSLSQ
jgi:hypothetical protein